MKQLILIVKTELFQLKQDKRLLVALIIFLLIYLSSVISILLNSIEYTYFSPHTYNILSSPINDISSINILIFLLCILSFSTCSLVAADITAGEKERNTLEILFMTKCPRHLIYWGKLIVGLIFSLIPFILGLITMILLTLVFPLNVVCFSDILRLFFLMIPYTLMISILLIHNGFNANNIRSAKSTELVLFLGIPFVCIILTQISSFWTFGIYYFTTIFLCVMISRNTIKNLEFTIR